jgi:hypothetical protein
MGDRSRDKIVGGREVDSVELLLLSSYEESSLKLFQLYELLVVM